MNFNVVLLLILLEETHGKWNLVWNDEFENQTLDNEKWEFESEFVSCHGNYVNQLNCNTDSYKNLRLIDGTLAITAIYEKYLDKDYTSGRITTKQSFTYGRFEIRAALPNAKLLRPAIFMIPVTSSVWARNGQIDIMTNDQTLKLGSGLHYKIPGQYDNNNMEEFTANTSLNDFHTYAIEWNHFEFKWFFDDINYLTININRSLGSIYTENGQPFHSPFRLLIHLGVGGTQFFANQILTVEDVMDWKCSLLIIDYVRIYKWVNGTERLDSKGDRVSTDKICSHVMPSITPKKKLNIAFTTIISVISVLLLIVLIPITLFLYLRQKNLQRMNIENNCENYDDICDTEGCDALNVYNDYSSPYEEVGDCYVESDGKATNLEITDKNENRISNPRYFTMNKNV